MDEDSPASHVMTPGSEDGCGVSDLQLDVVSLGYGGWRFSRQQVPLVFAAGSL